MAKSSRTTRPASLERLSKRLQTAGDPNRLRILCHLFGARKACVSDIAASLDVSVATASHHLQALAKGGILESARDGKNICYTLSKTGFAADLKRFICKYR